jgi:two-component system cell cycle sensor histidine kinase/response regulator CckA
MITSVRNAFLKLMRIVRPDSAPLRILIVDDEDAVRRFVQRVLSSAGVETWSAGGPLEALEVAQRIGRFDLLLTDLMMPTMNGDEMARRLRCDDPALKILYLTGFSDRLFAERMTLWENEAFLDKPCSIDGLLEAVSLAIYGHTTGLIRAATAVAQDIPASAA